MTTHPHEVSKQRGEKVRYPPTTQHLGNLSKTIHYSGNSIVSKATMTFEVLLDDGHQSILVERFEILGDAIACYVNCILNAKNDMNAVEIVDEYFETIASHTFTDSINDRQHQA